jgi:hypothetical protein
MAIAAAVALGCAGPLGAQPAAFPGPAGAASSDWRFALTPYVWLPTINAKIAYPLPGGGGGAGIGDGDGLIDTEIGPNKYLASLNFALMLSGEARRGPWSVRADFIGLRATGEGTSLRGVSIGGNLLPDDALSAAVDTGTVTRLQASMWNLTGGYTVFEDARHHVDAIAGVRIVRLEAELDWALSASVNFADGALALARSGTARVTKTPVDAVIGLRGRWRIDERWTIPYAIDVGTGSSQFTWHLYAGASYAFGWGEVLVGYRHLSLQDDRREIFHRLSLSGPAVGATFRF